MHEWEGFKIYPAGADHYGNDIIEAHTRDFGANAVVTLIDVWVLHNVAKKVKPALWLPWCVTGDTLVTMADGTLRAIANVQPGDLVLGSDKGKPETARVCATQKIPTKKTGRLVNIETETGRNLQITSDNFIFANKPGLPPVWQPVNCLSPGDMVYCSEHVSRYGSMKGDVHEEGALDKSRRYLSSGELQAIVESGNRERLGSQFDDDSQESFSIGHLSSAAGSTHRMGRNRNGILEAKLRIHDGGRNCSTSEALREGNPQDGSEVGVDFSRSTYQQVVRFSKCAGIDVTSNRIRGWHRRWRGDDQYSQGSSDGAKRANALPGAALDSGNRHAPGRFFQDNFASEAEYTCSAAQQSKSQGAVCGGLVRLSVLPTGQIDSTLLDRQAGTGANRDDFYRKSSADVGLQPAIYNGTARSVRTDTRFEPEVIVSIEDVPAPEYVYDLTTTTGNFVAGGILIHNCPIDHDPVPQRVLDCLEGAYLPLTYSKWGHTMLRNAGVPNRYIAHGVETNTFRILDDGEVARFRQQVLGNPEHLTIMVAANKGFPDRKAFQVQLRAWAAFAKDKPGARLVLHTEPTQMYGGIDFAALTRNLGIENKVIFPPRYEYFKGFPAEYMALFYNAADILLGASMSEGFGIPLIEAQACGTPVITTNFSAMPELVRWGAAVDPLDVFWTPMNSWQAWPNHAAITEALQMHYAEWEANGKRNDPAKRQFAQDAIHSEYSWDMLVREQWHPLVKRIAEEAVPVEPRFLMPVPTPVAPAAPFELATDNAPPLVAPQTNGLHPMGVTRVDVPPRRNAPLAKPNEPPATYAQEVEKMS